MSKASKTGSGMAPNVDGRPGVKKMSAKDAPMDKSCLSSARKDYERSISGKSEATGGGGNAMGSGKADTSAD